MKNWNYIEGAKTGNGILDIFKSEKPIKMKSSKGAIVTIHPDGSAAHQEKEGSQMAIHHYNSFKEAVEYYKNQGYVKVGNETLHEYATSKPRVINEEKTGAEEFFKKLSDDVKDREKKDDADIEKVGNSSISGGTFKSDDGSQKAVIDVNPQSGTARVVWFENDRQNGSSDYRSIDLATAAVKRKGLKKVGNKTTQVAQVGTVKIFYDDKDNVYYTNVGGSIFNNPSFKTKEEAVKYTVQKNKSGNKTGNAKDKNDKEIKVGDIVDVRGKKGKITKIIGDVIEVFYDNSGTYNPDRTDRYYADEAKKVGNAQSKINGKWVEIKSPKEELIEYAKKSNDPEYLKHVQGLKDRKAIDARLNWHHRFDNAKSGNSASDDKFAYVMREFDEGKLKTPDGKVVTDPAQAKAIAYSESKKTENGLARARNAMK